MLELQADKAEATHEPKLTCVVEQRLQLTVIGVPPF